MKDRSFVLGLVLVAAVGCGGKAPPASRHRPEELAEIAALDVVRRGRLSIRSLYPARPTADSRSRVTFAISSESHPVTDTEIRGLLDGTVKHHYNQGIAYHMRLGRRYSGMFDGEFELKRALIRWPLPPLVSQGRVVSARCVFWAERFFDRSIVSRGRSLPLHIYAYPIGTDWEAGSGGVKKDIFSAPAPGESSWRWAREGSREWPRPGALAYGEEDGAGSEPAPVAMGLVRKGDGEVVLEDPLLREFISHCLDENRSLDLLLKLDDEEEDRWGTQFALLTSDFGDPRDRGDRRPRLEVVVEFPWETDAAEWPFTLERGRERIMDRIELRGAAILDCVVRAEDDGVRPEVWVRGGTHATAGGEWQRLDRPLLVEWDWYEAKVTTAVGAIAYGESFDREILEPWVVPGPRDRQRPELLLIAPSGRVHRRGADPIDSLRYRFEFKPDETGLWRYGWCFSPAPEVPAHAHVGNGVFYVHARSPGALEEMARTLIRELRNKKTSDRSDQYRFNAFLRLAAAQRNQSPERWEEAKRWIAEVRRVLPREMDR